jgi:parallel beta-helix repeat protein
LAIEDTKGDAIKVQDAHGVTLRNLKISWTGGPSSENGAYGLYPVSCQYVLIEGCEVSNASDAGIYVGQSTDVIVRNNIVFNNVAGIEIENCIRADVYENQAYENTGGIFVFDLPELPQKNGHTIRLYDNIIRDNNHVNFASEGNTVALVPSGTGVLIMATRKVEIFGNKILNHHTTSTSVVSYLLTEKPFEDTLYNPFSYGVFIHDNEYVQTAAMPDTTKAMGRLVAGLFGTEVPEIIYDGMMDPTMVNEDGTIKEEARICIKNNGKIEFANINAPSGFQKVFTDMSQYDCELQMLSAVDL